MEISKKSKIAANKTVPNHLGIILDGNRRWAKERGLPTLIGHKKGTETTRKIISAAKDRGIKILTLFVFSTENWARDKREVGYLARLFNMALKRYTKDAFSLGIKVKIVGEIKKFPESLKKTISQIEGKTKGNNNMTLNLALGYGGRAEIVSALKNIIDKKIPPDNITEETVKDNLWLSDVDLIIRTGSAQRISNFLIWQAAYSELYFLPKFWPDFTEADLDSALSDYCFRKRNFGV